METETISNIRFQNKGGELGISLKMSEWENSRESKSKIKVNGIN
jgi:hypothetical protein